MKRANIHFICKTNSSEEAEKEEKDEEHNESGQKNMWFFACLLQVNLGYYLNFDLATETVSRAGKMTYGRISWN